MGLWFMTDWARLSRERHAVEEMQKEAEWLFGVNWSINTDLVLEAEIRIGDRDFNLTLTYPDLFPFAPPIARPTLATERWSTHQYGDGTLCLEWGPDTWQSDLTGADVLRSAYRLLSIEQPNPDGESIVAASRHQLTLGQELRFEYSRFCTTASFREFCRQLPQNSHAKLVLSTAFHRHCHTIVVVEATQSGGEPWRDPEVPKGLGASGLDAVLFKTTEESTTVSAIRTRTNLLTILAAHGWPGEVQEPAEIPAYVVIIDGEERCHSFLVGSADEDKVFYLSNLEFESPDANQRLGNARIALNDKRIGIVGMGSIGSKVAISLARHGVRKFVLVDADVLCPENLVRHQLDWKSVGDHKADAVASAIERVAAGVDITVSKIHLTGQESNAVLNGVLRSLADCNLLIDATADDQVFNLLSSVCIQKKLPLVWGQVFGGGFGGLVARSRPEVDHDPQVMRGLFNHYCGLNPFPQYAGQTDYAGMVDGQVMVAGDAEVSLIASHMVNFAVDTAAKAEPSRYPHSMYLIGFAREWVFNEPFHNIPISTAEPVKIKEKVDFSAEAVQDGIGFFTEILCRDSNETSNS